MDELEADFFRRDPVTCARELIGCTFRWHGCAGKIVETEAYAEFGDPACHTWSRPGARDFIERHDAGTAYVYLNYGVHWLFNILAKSVAGSGFVLFRALEPVAGLDAMRARRGDLAASALCSGPGKLTKALGIHGADHGSLFLGESGSGISRGHAAHLVVGPRVGISRATERQWRFGAANSLALSRKF
jgi:DNA-3-methyladenine glycosylase